MTTTTIRASLAGEDMPFLFRDANRTVLMPGLDQIPNAAYRAENRDWNNPHVLFVENVMPVSKGVISTAVEQLVSPLPGSTVFDQAIVLRDDQENNTLLVPAKGRNYILDNAGAWVSSLPFTSSGLLVTRAYTQGRTFVCYEKEKIFEYDGATKLLVDVTSSIVFPAGFTMADIRGVGGASNYLLLFTTIDLLWSSPNDPLNFNRLLNNGSGYQIPQDLRGQVSCILPVAGGAIIYTVRNAVSAVFTNNAATPFIFRGISNSGGVAGYEQVAYDADELFQYAWTSGGLQAVSLQKAENVYPEMTDFLTSGILEMFNPVTRKVDSFSVGGALSVKLTYVAQRYLVVSYGTIPNSYDYAYILDTALRRWGKVKVAHVDSFSYPYPNISGDLLYSGLATSYYGLGDTTYLSLGIGVISISPAKKTIAFLTRDGSVSILSTDYVPRNDRGVVLLGHIQQTRGRYTTLLEVECEGIDQSTPADLRVLSSENGKTTDRVTSFNTYKPVDNFYQSFQGRETAINHIISLSGSFQLIGMLIKVSQHGKV